jgi:adenylosuccinate lyase
MTAWDKGGDLKSLASADKDISAHLSKEQIDDVFSLGTYLRNVGKVFARVFG